MKRYFSKMNKAGQVIALWTLIININICASFKSFAQIENDTIIYWSKSRPIASHDFQGVIPRSKIKTDEVANIHSAIFTNGSSENDIPEYKVIVFFVKKKSWERAELSSNVLNHEQTHFNITELYGRKIRALIQKLNDQGIDDIDYYEKEIKNLCIQKDNTNDIYDHETRNGRDLLKQKEWDEKIATELETLKEYEVDYSKYIEE